MKKVLYLILLLIIACEDSKVLPKEYPYVIMKEVTTDQDGTEFTAEITGLGNLPITQYGFIWSRGSTIDSSNLFIKEIESAPSLGAFTLNVTSDLQEGDTYTVRPFIQTGTLSVIGNSVIFQSHGTNPPVMTDFFPERGNSGDTITITGSNLSLSKSRVEVFLGTDKAIVVSTDFQAIKFILPQKLSKSGKVPLKLNSGEFEIQADDLFLIEGHKIFDFYPKNGIIGETEVIIDGSGFLAIGNKVKIGPYNAVVLSESKTQLKIRLP